MREFENQVHFLIKNRVKKGQNCIYLTQNQQIARFLCDMVCQTYILRTRVDAFRAVLPEAWIRFQAVNNHHELRGTKAYIDVTPHSLMYLDPMKRREFETTIQRINQREGDPPNG